jgi:hypothetical protein
MINIENSDVFSLSDDTNGFGAIEQEEVRMPTCTVLPVSSNQSESHYYRKCRGADPVPAI